MAFDDGSVRLVPHATCFARMETRTPDESRADLWMLIAVHRPEFIRRTQSQ